MSHRYRPRRTPGAFTLVELLVVIAIIGVLVALLLPAIQAAREAARRNTCKNHLKQWATACITHESSVKHLPSGGWGGDWVGDADRGSGAEQPGGWVYNTLPYMEQGNIHQLPSDGARDDASTTSQRQGAWQMMLSSFPTLYCPSRRNGPTPATTDVKANNAYVDTGGTAGSPAASPDGPASAAHTSPYIGYSVGRTDYVGNAGDQSAFSDDGPPSMEAYLEYGAQFTVGGLVTAGKLGERETTAGDPRRSMTGVIMQRSEVEFRAISDGTSNTYLVGEKYLRPRDYLSGRGDGDELSWAVGAHRNTLRTAHEFPSQDTAGIENGKTFGSAHPSIFHMAYCDGHVESVAYDVDIQVHRNAANRGNEAVSTAEVTPTEPNWEQ